MHRESQWIQPSRVAAVMGVVLCLTSFAAADDPPAKRPRSSVKAPSTKVEQFKVTVVRARAATGKLLTKFDFSRASMNAVGGLFSGKLATGDPEEIKKFGDDFAPGLASGNVPDQAAHGLPTLAVDLNVETPRKSALICEIWSNGSAVDDQGRTLDSPKIGLYGTHRMSDDPWGIGRGTILLIEPKPGATRRLKKLTGELLVGPGQQLHFAFPWEEAQKPVTKKEGDKFVRLEEVQVDDGRIRVTAQTSGMSLPANPFNPADAFKAMAKALPGLDLVIVGSDGKVYYPESMSGGGGSGSSQSVSFGTSTQGNNVQSRNSTSGSNEPRYEFTFGPLPKEVRITSVEVILTIHDGETRRVPFTLSNVPVPFPAEEKAE